MLAVIYSSEWRQDDGLEPQLRPHSRREVGGGWSQVYCLAFQGVNLRAVIISVRLRPRAKQKSRCWGIIPGNVTVRAQGEEALWESSASAESSPTSRAASRLFFQAYMGGYHSFLSPFPPFFGFVSLFCYHYYFLTNGHAWLVSFPDTIFGLCALKS